MKHTVHILLFSWLLLVLGSCSSHKPFTLQTSKMQYAQASDGTKQRTAEIVPPSALPQSEYAMGQNKLSDTMPPFTLQSIVHKNTLQKVQHWSIAPECDQIVLHNGGVIAAKITEIGADEIKYKKCSNPDGPIYSISKTEVKEIQYTNGSTDTFSEARKEQHSPQAQTTRNIEGFSLASFLMALIGLVLTVVPLSTGLLVLVILLGLMAIVSGIIGMVRVTHNPTTLMGKGFGIAGMIIGILVLLACIGLLLFVL